MTREEKINTLTAIIQECEEYQWQRKEILFEIIKDLEQESVIDKIRAEIKALTSNRGFLSCSVDYIHKKIDAVFDKYKAEIEG